MTLFTKASAEPQPLPYSDIDAHGDTWSDLPNNALGRDATGWAPAPAAPAYDPAAASLAWANGAWVVKPFSADRLAQDFAQAKAAKLADLAAYRWDRQQTLMFNGAAMPADDTTVGRCNAAEAFARLSGLDLDAPRNWKLGDGEWTVLTTRVIIAYGLAIGTHMQACFDREKEISDAISAADDLPALDKIDITADWPA